MARIEAPLVERTVRSSDGTLITWYRVGSGPRAWLMPPAMGAPLIAMKHVLERVQRTHTVVTWDMRGFHRSGAPARENALAVDDHLADLEAVRRDAGLERFVLGGWSMGVQLALECYHRAPDRVSALVLINGAFERVLDTAVPLPFADAVLPGVLTGARAVGPVLNRLSRAVLGRRGMGRALQAVGLLARNPEFFEEILAEFRTVDWRRYLGVVELLHAHSAAAYLGEVRVPTLITAGTHDRMTPPALAERMARAIKGSELYVIERATHYAPAEFPELLGDRVAEFLARVDGGGRAPS